MNEIQPSYDPKHYHLNRRFLRFYRGVSRDLFLWWHGVWWGTLFFFGVGWAYSKWLCSMNWYRKFSNGRCMYCGENHVTPN